MPTCPECNGPSIYIGASLYLFHYRCRFCGIPFYTAIPLGKEVRT